MSKAVPNFRALALRSGELPKFFDGVLSRRAEEAVEKVGPNILRELTAAGGCLLV